MAQMNNFGLFDDNNVVVHDLIRSPANVVKENLLSALYKSIERAYMNFQVEVRKVLVNEKKEYWNAVNLDEFNEIEEFLEENEVWASCISH